MSKFKGKSRPNKGSKVIESEDFKIYVGGSCPIKKFELGAPKMAEIVINVK